MDKPRRINVWGGGLSTSRLIPADPKPKDPPSRPVPEPPPAKNLKTSSIIPPDVKLPLPPDPEPKEEVIRQIRKRLPMKKRRQITLSISVSEEEEEILRTAAFSKNMTFSEWSRIVLFRSLGRKVPKRPKRS